MGKRVLLILSILVLLLTFGCKDKPPTIPDVIVVTYEVVVTATYTDTPDQTTTMTHTETGTPTDTPTSTYTFTETHTSTDTHTPTITLTPSLTSTPDIIFPELIFTGPCSDNVADLVAGTGSVVINESKDLVTLCNGWVIYGDRVDNQIKVYNLFTGITDRTIQLTAAPNKLAYDKERGFLYVTLSGATMLAKVDVVSQSVVYISTSGILDSVDIGPDGKVFTNTINSMIVIDGVGNSLISSSQSSNFKGLIKYNKYYNMLYIGATGQSPATLYRYFFNNSDNSLTYMEYTRDLGSNATDMGVSPDGESVAYACGSGNGSYGYSIFDINPIDIYSFNGEWVTGAYPTAASFSPDGNYFATANHGNLLIFDRNLHTIISTTPAPSTDSIRARYSQGSRIVVGMVMYSYSGTYYIMWKVN